MNSTAHGFLQLSAADGRPALLNGRIHAIVAAHMTHGAAFIRPVRHVG